MHGFSKWALTIVFLGCGNSTNGAQDAGADALTTDAPSADAPAVDATKACADEASALCALRDSCSPGYAVVATYGSDATCESRTAQVCVNALAAKGTGNDAAMIETCAAAYPSEACSDFFDAHPVTACVPPAGTLTTGAPCGAGAQCESTYCAIGPHAICGTCQSLPIAGDSCQEQADCGRDLACATPAASGDGGVTTSGKCVARVADGGACLTGYTPCQSGESCVGEDVTTMAPGTCHAAGATVGAACDGTRKSMASCDNELGLVCVPSAKASAIGTCQKETLVGPNAACGDIGSAPITGVAVCQASARCKKTATTDATGTCLAAATDGAACDNDPLTGPPCLAPAKCVVSGSGTAGTCQMPNASTCQ